MIMAILTGLMGNQSVVKNFISFIFYLFIYLLFICAYNVWVISPPSLSPHPLDTQKKLFALISNFVDERV
jgi:hypothetical protein